MVRRIGFFSIRDWKVVTWLIWINVIFSSIALILWALYPDSIKYFALNPANILHGKYIWTLITHMFVHGGIGHLLVNMIVLFSLGGLSEKILGRKRFLWFYLISGLFAGLLSVVLSGFFGYGVWERVFGGADLFMVGASGAIFAIAGLYVVLLPRLKFMIIFLPFFSFPAYIIIPGALVVMWGLSIFAGWPIGNVAHFGGFLSGIVYGLYLKGKYPRKIRMLRRMIR